MRHTTKYFWIAYTTAKSHIAYAGEVFSRVVLLTVVLYVFSRLWLAVYGVNGGVNGGTNGSAQLAGLSLQQMLWYLVVTEAFTLSGPRTWLEVEQDVRSGRLAVLLIHPASYVLSHLSKALGERVPRFAVSMLVGAVVALLTVGPIRWTPGGIAMFLTILPSAFLLEFLGSFLVGLCAFWLESVNGIAVIYTRSVMLLGGVMFPIEIYPEWIQPFLKRLPFASMIYAPGRMFVDPQMGLFINAMATQLVALLVFAGVVGAVYKTALRRVFANGG